MAFKPVGVDTDTSLFPNRVMNALRAIFALKSAIPSTPVSVGAEPAGLSSATLTTLDNIYARKSAGGASNAVVLTQVNASKLWVFNHTIGRLPLVAVYNTDGVLIFPDVQATPSAISLVFADAVAGSVVLI